MTDSVELDGPDEVELSWLRDPQIAALSSACCFLLAHWSMVTMVTDRAILGFVLCISLAFIITTLYLTNANLRTCLGCLVWLYVVAVFAFAVGTDESLYIWMDIWAITSAAAIALASSSYSETFFQVWEHVGTPSYTAISAVCMFVLTDVCAHTMPPNGVARHILWALWFGYTNIVGTATKASPFVSTGCLTWLWIVSIFILTTESHYFRVFMVGLWAVTVITAFCVTIPPSFNPSKFMASHKLAHVSSTFLFLWVHVYLSRMGSNGFVIGLLWLSWATYTILILKFTIQETYRDLTGCLCILGITYGFVLGGWILMNIGPEGKKNPPVPHFAADIWMASWAVITCSSWAYFS